MTLQIDISIEAGNWPDQAFLQSLVKEAVLATAHIASLKWVKGAELSLLFTDDEHMSRINGQWRAKPRPTNVLSFPGQERQPGDVSSYLIGDLVFAFETVSREADEQEKDFNKHLTHLCVHGFLHLFGYDHLEDEQAEEMEALERKALCKLGIEDPYDYLEN